MIETKADSGYLLKIITSFFKLGFTAFGGPATAIAMMRQEFVLRRKWLNEDDFFDLLGMTNLVPGPNATELAIHIGYRQGGWPGLVLAGITYILPAMAIVLGFAWAYIRWGTLPALDGVLYGIKPVVIAILIAALAGMVKPRLKRPLGLLVSTGVFAAYLLGVGPLVLLLAGGITLFAISSIKENLFSVFFLSGIGHLLPLAQAVEPSGFDLLRLFWVFLKAGALMYGSGYVLLAFIQDDLVNRLGWLSESQLLDAIAVGQVTPGPLSTTATFVGYVTGGLPAALLATLAMFLPGFIFVAVTHPLLKKLRQSEGAGPILDGVNFAALGLMAGVTWEIGAAAFVDPLTVGIAVLSLILLVVYETNAPWLILSGGLFGLLRAFFFAG